MYYFIVNPIAGSGTGKKAWQSISGELDRLGIQYKDYQLGYVGEARRIAGELSKLREAFTVVIVGGDGTIDEFVDGLSDEVFSYLTLGCVPIGSANDFAIGIGLKTDPIEALQAVLNPSEIRQIKVGSVTGETVSPDLLTSPPPETRSHRFIVSSGIGFDADVCNGSYKSRMKDFLNTFHAGQLTYLTTALGLLVHMKQYPMTVTLETGEELHYENVFFVTAMNTPYEGGGFMFAPDADPAADTFKLVFAEGLNRRRVLQMLPLALKGGHVGKEGIHILDSKKFTVRAGEPLCIHTDGEILGFYNQAVFQALPHRLPVIIS